MPQLKQILIGSFVERLGILTMSSCQNSRNGLSYWADL